MPFHVKTIFVNGIYYGGIFRHDGRADYFRYSQDGRAADYTYIRYSHDGPWNIALAKRKFELVPSFTRYRLYYVKNEFFVVRITAAICTTVMWIILLIGTTITITIKYTYWYYLIHRE